MWCNIYWNDAITVPEGHVGNMHLKCARFKQMKKVEI